MKYLSSLKDKNLSKQICLLRLDFNITNADLRGYQRGFIPRINLCGGLTRKTPLRLQSVLPTIKFLIERGAKVMILSHRGRPKIKSKIPACAKASAGRKNQKSKIQFKIQNDLSLKPFVKILSKLLKKPIHFITLKELGLINKTREKIKNSPAGSVFVLENLRLMAGEEKNNKKFAKQLASLGNLYINDAFSVSHRKNASVVAITEFLSSYAGLLLEEEIKNLSRAMKNPKKPLVIIVGGAKISDKIGAIKNFLKRANYILIGGGIANTFFAAQKLSIGKSLYEKEMIPTVKKLLKSRKIILPIDLAIKKRKILDIGLETAKKYAEIIEKAKTIIWNGPMGYIEDKRFAKGTEAIAQAIIKSQAFSIVGGGETTSIMSKVAFAKQIPGGSCQKSKVFISSGGGAMLEYLAGKKLPGLKTLNNI